MKRKLLYIWYDLSYYWGIFLEKAMAFCFNVSHFIVHGKRPHIMGQRMFEEFKDFLEDKEKQ